MTSWDLQAIERVLMDFLGEEDPSDPKQKKRRRIVEAATELFIRHGYRKTSIDEVARNAGVAKGTVYLYFATKNELMLHAIAEEKRRYFEKLRPIFDPSLPPQERLRLWLKAVFVVGTEMPLVSRLLSGDRELTAVLDDVEPAQNEHWTDMQNEFVSQMIMQAMPAGKSTPGEIGEMARVLLGLMYFGGPLVDDRVRRGLSLERYAEVLSGLIVDGIVASNRECDTSKS